MTNQQVLEKAIKLAIDGGWESQGATPPAYEMILRFDIQGLQEFAKALWGVEPESEKWDEGMYILGVTAWKHHLMKMVIADDPIAYLGEHLPQ